MISSFWNTCKISMKHMGCLQAVHSPLGGLGASIPMHLSFLCSRSWWPPQCGPGPRRLTEAKGFGCLSLYTYIYILIIYLYNLSSFKTICLFVESAKMARNDFIQIFEHFGRRRLNRFNRSSKPSQRISKPLFGKSVCALSKGVSARSKGGKTRSPSQACFPSQQSQDTWNLT